MHWLLLLVTWCVRHTSNGRDIMGLTVKCLVMTVIRAPLCSNDLRPVRTLPHCLSSHVSWNGGYFLFPCCFIFSPFLPSHLTVRCFVRRLFALCLSDFFSCQAIRGLNVFTCSIAPQAETVRGIFFFFFPFFLKILRVNKCRDGSAFWHGVRVRSNWGWGERGQGPVGVSSRGSTRWPRRRQQLVEREAHRSAARRLGSCVLHVAPGGKGNSLAQLNTSFVFIKRMGMLVFAGWEDV